MNPTSVLTSAALPLLYWIMIVVLVTLFGYPGVVLLTPGAWLLALVVGRGCILRASEPRGPAALVGAAGAGALFGFFLGVVFGVASQLLGGLTPEQEEGMRTLTVAVTIAGALVCAALATLMGLIMRGRV